MDDPLTYLPPGWTEEKWTTSLVDEMDNLAPEELPKVGARLDAEKKRNWEQGKASALRREQQKEERMIARGEQPAKRVGPKVYDREMPPLVKLLDLKRTDEWGFAVLWTSHKAKTNESAKRIIEALSPISMSRLEALGPHTRLEEIMAAAHYIHLLDGSLSGAKQDKLRKAFYELEEDRKVPHAVMHRFALVLDDAAFTSFLADPSDESPFLTALEVDWRPNRSIDSTYQGMFKVAAADLPDFYTTILDRNDSGEDLYEMTLHTGIWQNPVI